MKKSIKKNKIILLDNLHEIKGGNFNPPSNSVFGGPPVATYGFTQQLP